MPRSPRRWTPQEDRILLAKGRQLFSEGEKTDSTISWSSVSNAIPDRNNKDCRKRWYKLTGANKGLWAVSEDERLLEGVRKYGSQWTQVAKTVETRSSDQCAKRWQQCLDPSLDHSAWTSEMDARLLAAVKRCGTNWRDIQRFEFPGRSSTNLKNRHIALLRQKSKENNVYPDEGKEADMDWLSLGLEMSDGMVVDGIDDGDYSEGDQNRGPHAPASASPLHHDLSLVSSPFSSMGTDTAVSASSAHCHLPLDWGLPSPPDLVQPTDPRYASLETFLESGFSHASGAESVSWKDLNHCEHRMPHLPTPTTSLPSSQHANLSTSHTPDDWRPGKSSHQESTQLPQSATSPASSSSAPQMIVTIDNPDPQTMTSILEVLTKAKSKVAISIVS